MSTQTLYEISQDYSHALVELEQLDLPEEAVRDTLEGLQGELEQKAVNVAAFIRNLENTASGIKEAEQAMAKRRRAIENRIKAVKDYLLSNMVHTGIQKIESPWFVLGVRKNPPSVVVEDLEALPSQYRQEVITVKPDKVGIKGALKDGQPVPGAHLINGVSLSIR